MIADLLVHTLRDPRGAARRLLAMDVPPGALWTGLLLVAVLALTATRLSLLLAPVPGQSPMVSLVSNIWLGVPVQIGSLLFLAGLATGVGRIFGGQGRFLDAVLLVSWLEFLLVVAQGVQIALILVMPPAAVLIAIASFGLFLWLLTQFIAALHGFESALQVAFGMLGSAVVIVVVAAILMQMTGIAPGVG